MKLVKKEKILELKKYFMEEIFGQGIGWIAGIFAVEIMSNFFEKRSWTNLWGLWSDKMVINDTSFTIGEWTISIIIGFIVMKIFNKLSLIAIRKTSIKEEFPY